jgi:hypothetical protein
MVGGTEEAEDDENFLRITLLDKEADHFSEADLPKLCMT